MVDVVCVCLFCLLSLNSMSIIVFIRVLMFFGLLLLIVFHNCFLILGLYGVSEFINLKPEYVKTIQNIQTWQHCSWTRLNYFRYVSFDCKAIGQKNPNSNIVAFVTGGTTKPKVHSGQKLQSSWKAPVCILLLLSKQDSFHACSCSEAPNILYCELTLHIMESGCLRMIQFKIWNCLWNCLIDLIVLWSCFAPLLSDSTGHGHGPWHRRQILRQGPIGPQRSGVCSELGSRLFLLGMRMSWNVVAWLLLCEFIEAGV